MFYVKYVVVDCTVTEYFECNEKNGITNDFLLIPATSFNCKAGENIQTFPPYTAFFQGGLTWYHGKLGIMMALQKLYDANLVKGM